MQFTGVDKFFRVKIYQYKKCIFLKKKVTKDWHYLQSTASISPPELAFQFTYSSMGTAGVRRSWDYPLTRAHWTAGNMVQPPLVFRSSVFTKISIGGKISDKNSS